MATRVSHWPLAYETILGDKLVNRRIEKLDAVHGLDGRPTSAVACDEGLGPPTLGALGVQVGNGAPGELEIVEQASPLGLLDPALDEVHTPV